WHPWGTPPPAGEREREQRQRVDSTSTGPVAAGPGTPGLGTSISGTGLVASPAPVDRDATPMQLNHPISGPAPPAPTPVQKVVPVPNKTPPEAKASGSNAAPSASGSGTTPREAAALAALRRFQAGRSTESLRSHAAAGANAKAAPASLPGTPAIPAINGVMSESRSSARSPLSMPAPSESTYSLTPTSPPRGHVPNLIPLYNPGSAAANPGTTSPSPYFAGATNTSVSSLINPTLPRSPLASSAFSSTTMAQSSPPRFGQLPPNLSESQLSSLDRVTREAIDERLRVLEGVQATVWRCVEELTRLRSVLPDPTRQGSTESAASGSIGSSFGVEIERNVPEINVDSANEGESEVEGKGKGKERIVENGDVPVVGEASGDPDVR
ncbi:E3 ubiquitin-protein ligase hrd1, partial [Ceratobasidium sp. 392]